jgi:hypothetical protein
LRVGAQPSSRRLLPLEQKQLPSEAFAGHTDAGRASVVVAPAALYCVTPVVFLRHCVAALTVNIQTIDYGVTEEAAEWLAMPLRCEPADIHGMTPAELSLQPQRMNSCHSGLAVHRPAAR